MSINPQVRTSKLDVALDQYNSDQIKAQIKALADEGHASLRPGDVLTRLRKLGSPIGAWNIRAEFTRLTREGFLEFDAEHAHWCVK